MKRCRVILAFNVYNVGDVIELPPVMYGSLSDRGFVKVLSDDDVPVVERGIPPGTETATMDTKKKRKRGRPRLGVKP